MFTVAVVEDDGTAVGKLRACLDQYAATHAGVQFDVTVFNEPTSFLDPYKTVYCLRITHYGSSFLPTMNVCRHAEEGVASVKEEGTMNTQRSNTVPLVARIVKTVVLMKRR